MLSFERKLERINRIIEKLKSEASAGTLLVVEGEKDAESLREMGITGNIIAIKSFRGNLPDIINEIISCGDKGVIPLMDFDRRGRELTKRLVESLEMARIKVNVGFWQDLSNLLNNDIKDIEGLCTYIKTLKRKIVPDSID